MHPANPVQYRTDTIVTYRPPSPMTIIVPGRLEGASWYQAHLAPTSSISWTPPTPRNRQWIHRLRWSSQRRRRTSPTPPSSMVSWASRMMRTRRTSSKLQQPQARLIPRYLVWSSFRKGKTATLPHTWSTITSPRSICNTQHGFHCNRNQIGYLIQHI
jgi:hypothetical protein